MGITKKNIYPLVNGLIMSADYAMESVFEEADFDVSGIGIYVSLVRNEMKIDVSHIYQTQSECSS